VLLDPGTATLDQNRQNDHKQQAGDNPDDDVCIHFQILSWNVVVSTAGANPDPRPNLQSKLRRASIFMAPAEP
jgi:hypothetical protein